MQQYLKRTSLAGLTALACISSQATATIILFNDKPSFISTTGASSATGAIPDLGAVANFHTLGTVTLSITPPASQLFIGSSGTSAAPDWSPVSPGNDIAISNIENLNADFAAPVFSAGFDFVEPTDATCYAPCFDSTFTVTLKNGGTFVDSFNFNAPDDVLAFVGVWSNTAFDRMEITDTTATIDDEYYGEFFTGTTPIPVPATAWLLGSGLIGFLMRLQHRNKR